MSPHCLENNICNSAQLLAALCVLSYTTLLRAILKQSAFLPVSLSYHCLAFPHSELTDSRERSAVYLILGTQQALDKWHVIKYQFLHESCSAYHQLNMIFPIWAPPPWGVQYEAQYVWVSVCMCVGEKGEGDLWPPREQGSVWEQNKNTWIGRSVSSFSGHLVGGVTEREPVS